MPAHVLQMRDVSKRFGGVRALAGVSLTLDRGTVLGLVGQNGAGKSTLMKILDGQYPYGTYQGEVLVDGRPVRMRSPRDAARTGIGIVPQETTVVDTLTVGENVHLARYGRRLLTVRGLHRQAQQFLDQLGLPLAADRRVSGLTTSEKQLVMIARTLRAAPRILILDEPTTALTGTEVARLLAAVRTLRDRGVGTILISHRLDEVFEVADEIAVLRDGRVVDRMPRPQFDRHRVVSGIAGREIGDLFPPRGTGRPGEVVLRVSDLVVVDPRSTHRNVVDGVSLAVRAGEVVGIGGALGSGRSETVEALFGLRPVAGGQVEFLGRPLGRPDPRRCLAAGIAFVPEDRKTDGLCYNGTVEDNLTLALLRRLTLYSIVDARRRRRLALAEIERYAVRTAGPAEPVGALSGGNQQKVLIARAGATSPRLLLLDEPTKGVDVGAKADIYRLIRRAAEAGTAVLLVSSEMPELLGLCDRVLVLRAGRVVDELDAQAATERDLLVAAMSGQAPPSTAEGG